MLTESARDPGQGGQRTQWSEVLRVSQHMGREELSVAGEQGSSQRRLR